MIDSNTVAYISGVVVVAVLSFVAGSLIGFKNDAEFYTKFHAECEKLLKDSKNDLDEAADYYARADKRYKEADELLEQARQFLGIEE